MPRLIGCLFGIVLVGTSSALLGEARSYSSSCGDEAAMTFENWRKWTKVTPKPVISKAHNNNWVGVYVDDVAKATYLAEL